MVLQKAGQKAWLEGLGNLFGNNLFFHSVFKFTFKVNIHKIFYFHDVQPQCEKRILNKKLAGQDFLDCENLAFHNEMSQT